jgi:hypothetical protein
MNLSNNSLFISKKGTTIMTPKMFTHLLKQKGWLVLASGLIIGLALTITATPAAAHGGDTNGDGSFTTADCASHLGQVSWNGTGQVTTSGFGTLLFHTGSGWWAYAEKGTKGTSCEDFAYLLVNASPPAQKTYLIYPTWLTTKPAEWCGHSLIDYAVFVRPQGQSSWTFAGGGYSFGKHSTIEPEYYDKGCQYFAKGVFPPFKGKPTLKFPFHRGQIAVIVQFWAHNHTDTPTTDCRYENCFHPGRVYVRHG